MLGHLPCGFFLAWIYGLQQWGGGLQATAAFLGPQGWGAEAPGPLPVGPLSDPPVPLSHFKLFSICENSPGTSVRGFPTSEVMGSEAASRVSGL